MESDARPPEKLSNTGLMHWNRWKKMFLNYMKLTGGINKADDEKVAWLKNLIGPVGLEALENISFDNAEDEDNMTIVMNKLDLFFDPPKNEVAERHKFFCKSKKHNVSIDDYVDDLKEIAKLCNFGEQMNSLVRDAVILDIKDKHLRELMFEEKELDLEKLKIIYKTYEINTARMKDVSKEVIPEKTQTVPKQFVPRALSATREPKNPCWRCGERHAQRACPAWNKVCCYCKQLHHFSYRCPIARLDKVTLAEKNATVQKDQNLSSPFQIDKNLKVNKGVKNNLNSLADVDKDKNFVKRETFHSDPVLKNFEIVESGNPKKVHNQFLSRSNPGKQSSSAAQVTSQHPLSQTTIRMPPSAPSVSLLDFNAQRPGPVSQSSPGKQVFQINKYKIAESSEKQQPSTLQSNYQLPRQQSYQVNAARHHNSLSPHLPSTNSTTPVPQYSPNNLQSNARGGFPHSTGSASYNSSLNIRNREQVVKPKQKNDSECLIS